MLVAEKSWGPSGTSAKEQSFPELISGITQKLRRYTSTIQAKLWDTLNTFQTTKFTRCFKQWHGFAV
jgi:hypothetical protein